MNKRAIAIGLLTLVQPCGLFAQPSNAVVQRVNADREFYFAVSSGDLAKAREALTAAKKNGKPISNRGVCIQVLESKHFLQLSPLIDELLKTNAPAILGEDSVFFRLRPEHIAWMDKSGYLSARIAPRFLVLAAQKGDSPMVKALLNTTVGKEFSDDTKQHGLFAATGARCLECVDELLHRGAQPDRGMRLVSDQSQAMPAVDIAARIYWITGLKRLDRAGKYKQFLADFEKEFPQAKASPLIGDWTNRKDGFGPSQIRFGSDATGILGASVYGGSFVWKASEDRVTLFFVTGKGIDREHAVELTYNAQSGELLWSREKGETERYRKVVKAP